jgi:hypothetical protein
VFGYYVILLPMDLNSMGALMLAPSGSCVCSSLSGLIGAKKYSPHVSGLSYYGIGASWGCNGRFG